jgi:hypothetical protein
MKVLRATKGALYKPCSEAEVRKSEEQGDKVNRCGSAESWTRNTST